LDLAGCRWRGSDHPTHDAGDDRGLVTCVAHLVDLGRRGEVVRNAVFPDAPLVLGPVSVSCCRLFVLARSGFLIVVQSAVNRTKLVARCCRDVSGSDTASLRGVKFV